MIPEHRIAIKERIVERVKKREIVLKCQMLDMIRSICPFKCYIVKDEKFSDFAKDFIKRFHCLEVSALSLESEEYTRLITASRNQIMDIKLPVRKREIDIDKLEKMFGIGLLKPVMKGMDILMKNFGDLIEKKIDKKKFDEMESILEEHLKRIKVVRK